MSTLAPARATALGSGVPLGDPNAVRLDRIDRLERLEEVRSDWDRLAEGAGHPFATWEWLGSWWERMGEGRDLYSFVGRDAAGEVIVILPLYVDIVRPIRIARFIGYGDLASPLCLPEHRPLAAEAIRRVIGRGRGRCRKLLAENMPPGEGWHEMLGGHLVEERPDPVIRIDGSTWEEFLAGKSRRFRKLVGQQERRLQRDFDLSYRLADDPDRIDEDISILFNLHDAHWGECTTGVFHDARGEMQRLSMRRALDRGWLRLWIMELDGCPVAADLAWRWQGSEWGMNCGRDPAFDDRSVGAVLMAHAVREACVDGVRTYRLLQGDASYKLRYATDVPSSETIALGSGGLLEALVARATSIGFALPEPLRRRIKALLS